MVSTYVFWNHHQPDHDRGPDFSGQLDLASFISLVRSYGMDVALRIGPFVHAESRHGGLPDWVAEAGWRTRTNDPRYLAAVSTWFSALGDHLSGTDLDVIQIENELYDQPEHVLTLKTIARAAGLSAPLTTATAWGGAQFDRSEFLPVYGGYPDTFWSRHSLGWEPRCAIHYHFQALRDDALIGEDGRLAPEITPADDSPYPYATCELGGGMATSYHRRPQVTAPDVAALGIAKLGSGSVWHGWYMMAGGMNPLLGDHPLHESVSTGAPNELPIRDYDFSAPIGAAGQLRASAHALRAQHTLVQTFGAGLATSDIELHDDAAVRYAVRSWQSEDAETSLVFFNNHQPLTDLGSVDAFQVRLTDGTLVPPVPVAVAQGDYGIWAANLPLGEDVRLVATDLMPLARLTSARPTWLFAQTVSASRTLLVRTPAGEELVELDCADELSRVEFGESDEAVTVLVVSRELAAHTWILGGRCFLSAAPLIDTPQGMRAVCDPATSGAVIFQLTAAGRTALARCPQLSEVPLAVRAADLPSSRPDEFSLLGSLTIPSGAGALDRLRIRWTGNVLRVVAGSGSPDRIGDILADQFWHGEGELVISLAHLAGERHLDLYVRGFAPGEHLVSGQRETCEIREVSLLPVQELAVSPS